MENEVDFECKPCSVLLDGHEISKFYCPKRNQYVIDTEASSSCENPIAQQESCVLRNSAGDLTCKICSQPCNNLHQLYHHVWRKHIPARFCQVCFVYFLKKGEFSKHLNSCFLQRTKVLYKCDACSETFQLKADLHAHISLKHTENDDTLTAGMITSIKLFANIINDGEYKKLKLIVHCIACSIDFDFDTYFLDHFFICYKNSDFVCPFCSMSRSHFKNVVEHLGKHLNFSNITVCAHCQCSFFTDLNASIHSSRVHTQGIIKKNTSHRFGRKAKAEIQLTGFEFLDFLNPDFSNPSKKKNVILKKKHKNVVATDSKEITNGGMKMKREKLDIKSDIEQIISDLQKKNLLEDTPSMYCGICKSVFCLETYVMHLIACLQQTEFACPFCDTSSGEGSSADDRWGHIKLHLINLTSSLVGSGSVCVMCDELFLTDYNMALHAQFVHFL